MPTPHREIAVSAQFKRMTTRAILSILLFIAVYLILVAVSIAIAATAAICGLWIICLKPAIITIMLGLGMVGMGVLIFAFMIKFMFEKNKVDRLQYVEVSAQEQPELFEFVRGIVKETGTKFPKKIYLSYDVNASVFYDSGFWSMFLPANKNLSIGMGLVNSVSVSEFKAVLGHEFGHFSQRSMKVGTYVYNVNKVIYNMLYNNDSFNKQASQWASISGYFAIFVRVAGFIVGIIQRILQQMYNVVNLSYMGLSRQMEFHADEVAANVAGSKPLVTALLRFDLANSSLESVLNYYNKKVRDCVATKNIYPQQNFVMKFIATENKIQVVNEIPQVIKEQFNRYNRSKLTVENQWASHPRTLDRVAELERLHIEKENNDNRPAVVLFRNLDVLQNAITQKLFDTVTYSAEITYADVDVFSTDYKQSATEGSFNKMYNGYYNHTYPSMFDLDKAAASTAPIATIEELYGDDVLELVYDYSSLEGDIRDLEQIKQGNYKVKSFDYDGTRYSAKDADSLIPRLKKTQEELKGKIAANDENVYRYFLQQATKDGRHATLRSLYSLFFRTNEGYKAKMQAYIDMVNATAFMRVQTKNDIIVRSLVNLKPVEDKFTEAIAAMLKEDIWQKQITTEMREKFDEFLSREWIYFKRQQYEETATGLLFACMANYYTVLVNSWYKSKKDILEFQANLVGASTEAELVKN